MAQIEKSILRIQRLVGTHSLATDDLVLGFLNDRHSSLLESFDWSRKKSQVAITMRVDKTAGTLTPSNGSTTVNGVGTAFTASDVGRYVTMGSDQDSLYVVRTVNNATQFTLGDLMGNTVMYPGSGAAGLNYVMFTRLYSLPPGAESILHIKGQQPLGEVSEEYLDDLDPARTAIASQPYCYAPAARDQNGTKDISRIEIYPRVSAPVIITASVKLGHVDLKPSQYPIVPSGPLEWFGAVDICYALASRTKDTKWAMLADKYNTEAEKALEREKTEDQHKWGLNQNVKDAYGGVPLSETDFALNHDTGD